jgi:hypothetical protein
MSNKDKDQVTDLSPQGASDYKARIEAAKSGRIPVGGAEMPSIPRLDQAPPGSGDRHLGVQQAHQQMQRGDIKKWSAMTAEEYQKAVEEGSLVPGVGSAYAANQPSRVAPKAPEDSSPEGVVNPPRPEGGLRPETKKQLEEMAAAASKKEDEGDDDEEYFSKLSEATKDILNNKERRQAIEDKIRDELDFENLILNQELRQRVPIRKGFEPTFRTLSAEEDLFVKRIIGDDSGSDRYVLDRYIVMNLTCGLYALNNKPLPTHIGDSGKPDKDLFYKKLEAVLKYPLVLIADLSANFTWFNERVQKLLSVDEVRRF